MYGNKFEVINYKILKDVDFTELSSESFFIVDDNIAENFLEKNKQKEEYKEKWFTKIDIPKNFSINLEKVCEPIANYTNECKSIFEPKVYEGSIYVLEDDLNIIPDL